MVSLCASLTDAVGSVSEVAGELAGLVLDRVGARDDVVEREAFVGAQLGAPGPVVVTGVRGCSE